MAAHPIAIPPDVDFSFTFAAYRRLLAIATGRFDVRPVAEALAPGERPVLVLRHDVDISLDAALRLAEIEAAMGVRASYLVLLDWPLYDIEAPVGRAVLRRLRELGHDVGLHVDPRTSVAAGLPRARDRVAAASGAPVRAMSFHRPTRACFRQPIRLAGMVNACAHPLTRTYVADSRGRFRYGHPEQALLAAQTSVSQLLVHPIWWGERHRAPAARLRKLVHREAAQSGLVGAQQFADALAAAVPAVPF